MGFGVKPRTVSEVSTVPHSGTLGKVFSGVSKKCLISMRQSCETHFKIGDAQVTHQGKVCLVDQRFGWWRELCRPIARARSLARGKWPSSPLAEVFSTRTPGKVRGGIDPFWMLGVGYIVGYGFSEKQQGATE